MELAYLRRCSRRQIARSTPQFAVIVGEPGIGKSRLVAELFAYVDARPEMITWRQGRCPPYGEGVTFWALAEIVKAHAGILETDDSRGREAKLDAVVPDGPDRAWMGNRLRALLGLEAPPATRDENFTAWLRFIEELALAAPIVLVFEDLHWADEALLAFIEHLATHADAVPLLVIGTARPELFEQHPAFAAGSTHVNRISLDPLTPEETQRLVAGLVGDVELTERHGRRHRRALRGQPLLRRGVGAPARRPGAERAGAGLGAGRDRGAPRRPAAGAQGGARRRRRRRRRLLGRRRGRGGAARRGRSTRPCSDLVAKQLVRRVRESSMRGENEFAFAHALARDVAYGQLPARGARREARRGVAAWIEGKAGDRLEDLAEVLAHHYTDGARPRQRGRRGRASPSRWSSRRSAT